MEGTELVEDVRAAPARGGRVGRRQRRGRGERAAEAAERDGEGRARRGRAVRGERVVEELVQRAGGGGALIVSAWRSGGDGREEGCVLGWPSGARRCVLRPPQPQGETHEPKREELRRQNRPSC